MDQKKENEVQLEIQMDEDVASGQYINLAVVNHNDSEFIIDCIYVQPQAPKARVQSRIITSPRHAKRLMAALKSNIDSYEKKFGNIEMVAPENRESNNTPMH